MNPEEKVVRNYFDALDAGSVVFEPDGNIPPDFSIDGSIGVEVRRLNENYFGGSEAEGLEELSIPLWKDLKAVLADFDECYNGNTYGVFLEYERPSMGTGQDTADAVRDALEDFLDSGGAETRKTLNPSKNLELEVVPISSSKGEVFLLAGGMDWNRGGWTMGTYVENISHCLQEKRNKVASHLHRYDSWWLVLVDRIKAWSSDEEEVSQIRSEIPGLEIFDRLIVINQKGDTRLDANT